jgi:sugar-specific transcriptional regulator TrmB
LTEGFIHTILTTMVVNKIQSALRDIGFSEYEARAYVSALVLKAGSAYEIARDANIPTSKIYETIARLKEKELLFEAAEAGKKKYVALSGAEFLARARSLSDKRFESLARDLKRLPVAEDVSFIWNIGDHDALVEKSGRLVREARQSLLLSLWPEELEKIFPELEAAQKRGVAIAVIHFGPIDRKVGTMFAHPIEDTLYAERGGRGFTLVADSRLAVMGTIFDKGGVEGAWSANRGFVLLAEDYLKHDIYIMKIVNRFDRELIGRFGKNYAMLRDIFRDREVRS